MLTWPRVQHTHRYLAVAALVALGIRLSASPGQDSQPRFSSRIDIVPLTVTVEKPDGSYATRLVQSDFRVFDDGLEQTIAIFESDQLPIDLVLLMDTSASMVSRFADTKKAAVRLVHALRPADRWSLMAFGRHLSVNIPFTSDGGLLEPAIERLQPDGSGTALFNALYVALRELRKTGQTGAAFRRQAIVLLSDGDDNASVVSYDSALDLARQAGVAIYTISVEQPAPPGPTKVVDPGAVEYRMRSLSHETGGRSFFPRRVQDLQGVYTSIAHELAHQYWIGFEPPNRQMDGRVHRITVLVDEPDARVRSRTSYVIAQ